jgi:FMN phosphatase YigB (HAD superfamily)
MKLIEMIGSLLYFDSLNGLRQLDSSEAVTSMLSEYRRSWQEGFELSCLFDSRYYASQLPPNELDSLSPLEHYLSDRDRDGDADPHPLLDASFYRNRYGGLSGGLPAIVDYAATFSKMERGVRAPGPYFDPGYYLSRNPDVASSSIDPFVHFLKFGADEGRPFHPFLDLDFVREHLGRESPEVAGLSPLELLRYSIAFNVLDRVDPSPLFSNRIYRDSKPGRIDRNPFHDFMVQTDPYRCGDPVGTFSVRRYVSENPSINYHFTNPYSHYLTFGCSRSETSDLLSWSAYLEENGDVRDGRVLPLVHLFAHGFREGRYVSKAHRKAVRARLSRYCSERLTEAENPTSETTYVLRRADCRYDAVANVSMQTLGAAALSVLTVDFWDTLMLRTSPHWAGKLHTAKQLHTLLAQARRETPSTGRGEVRGAGFRQSRPGVVASNSVKPGVPSPDALYRQRIAIEAGLFAEGIEYDFRTVMARQLRRLAPFDAPNATDKAIELLIDKLLLAEQHFEGAHVVLNRSLLQLMEERLNAGAQVAIVSDFYHPAAFLRGILQGHGVSATTLEMLKVFSSCEEGASKLVQGKLFDKVAQALSVNDRSEWLHIGDSEQSDVRSAYATGISSIHFRCSQGAKQFELPEPSSVSDDTYEMAAFAAFDESARRATVNPVQFRPDGRHGEIARPLVTQAGQEFAMIPVLLVLAALEEAAARGLSQVVYLSREGVFLERIHAAIRSSLGPDLRHIGGIHLKTSRRSLFAPTFAANEAAAIAIFASQYPTASVTTLLGALLPTEELGRIDAAERQRLSFTTVADFAKGGTPDKLLSPQTLQLCRGYAAQQHALLSRYLNEQRVSVSRGSQMLFCDIGWRGTMQDMLAFILPDVRSIGVYLGLFPFHLEQSANAEKIGIAFDGNRGDPFAHVDPPAAIERTWTPNVGSAVGYANGQGADCVVVRLDESDCTAEADRNIGAFQDEVLRAAPTVVAEYVRYGMNRHSIRRGLSERLECYYREPHPGISELWFSSLHDDTFGSGENPYKKSLPPINQVSNTNLRYLIEAQATHSRWKDGYRNWPAVHWFETLLGEKK